jgi:RNA polymerase primary sigma factor
VPSSPYRGREPREKLGTDQSDGAQPRISDEQIAKQMELPFDAVGEVLKIVTEPLSLEAPVVDDEETSLGDPLEDRHPPSPVDAAMALLLVEQQTREALMTLTPREEQIVRLHFGVGQKFDSTLEEVGHRFAVTRERVQQIEAEALRKLRVRRCARVLT